MFGIEIDPIAQPRIEFVDPKNKEKKNTYTFDAITTKTKTCQKLPELKLVRNAVCYCSLIVYQCEEYRIINLPSSILPMLLLV